MLWIFDIFFLRHTSSSSWLSSSRILRKKKLTMPIMSITPKYLNKWRKHIVAHYSFNRHIDWIQVIYICKSTYLISYWYLDCFTTTETMVLTLGSPEYKHKPTNKMRMATKGFRLFNAGLREQPSIRGTRIFESKAQSRYAQLRQFQLAVGL